MRRVAISAVLLFVASALAVPAWPALGVEAQHGHRDIAIPSDFNGDGFADLAVGVTNEDVTGGFDAGAVNVIYGSAVGLDDAGNQFWTQDSEGIKDRAEGGDHFGLTIGTGDFDGDGFSDLVVGTRFETVQGVETAGIVNVIYGSAAGLTEAGDQVWTQGGSIQGSMEAGDQLGTAVAAGDFNADGFDDLAIGVPHDLVSHDMHGGAVNVIYGSAAGLTAAGNQRWMQGKGGIQGRAGGADEFGEALVAGDFNGDGADDLAVGAPGDILGPSNPGAVNVIYGSVAIGLTSAANQLWTQDSDGILDDAGRSEEFGKTLAAGDFDSNGIDDLAVGVPVESVGGASSAGAVNVILGSAGVGLTSAGNQFWNQDSDGVLDQADSGDGFGSSLAAGDFNADGAADLGVGVPTEWLSPVLAAVGSANVLYGSPGVGLTSAGNQFWNQDSPGILDQAEPTSEQFARSIAAGDFDGDGAADLAVGVPVESLEPISTAGAANVIYGSALTGLTSAGNQFWNQDSDGILDQAEDSDVFGDAVG